MKRSRIMSLAACAAATGLSFSLARAADLTWNPASSGSQLWDLAANWDGVAFPNAVDDKASFGVGLASDVTASIPVSGITIGSLTLGGTAAAVTTNLAPAGAGAKLIFQVGSGSATIFSTGVAGSNNIISTDVQLNKQVILDATSTRSLTLSGAILLNGGTGTITNNTTFSGAQLVISGNMFLWDQTTPLTNQTLAINSNNNTTTVINGTFVRGDGTTTGATGSVALNIAGINQPFATFIVNSPQTIPAIELGKCTVVLGNNDAMGIGTINTRSNNNSNWGADLQSNDDSRKIQNNILAGNAFAFTGNNSLTVAGFLTQSNNRSIGNALAPGKTLTLSGDGTANTNGVAISISSPASAGNRTWIFDGPGKTVVNGKIINNTEDDVNITGAFTKRGTGTVVINNPANTYKGATAANGGLLVFGADGAWGATSGITANGTGGVWYAPGSADPGFNNFLDKIQTASRGSLALPATEAATNFDLSAAHLSNAASMTIGAQGNLTYTGTVTPGVSGYGWGGMTGVLTLNGNDRMVGPNIVRYGNGGTVILNGDQSYTGATTLGGANMATAEAGIATKTGLATSTANVFYSTVLQITSIATGSISSALGASSSDAANLVFNGGTLRYVGPATSTDRLFSVGTLGGTIDNSGTGALVFSNPGANLSIGNGNRTLTLTGNNTAGNTVTATLSDAGAGSVLSVTKSGSGKWILGGNNTYTGATTVSGGSLELSTRVPTGSAVNVTAGNLKIAAKGTPNSSAGTSVVPSITIAAGGAADLTNNSAVIDYTTLTTQVTDVRGQLRDGRLTSSAATATTRLGYGDNALLGKTTFAGVAPDSTSVLIKYTYAGDADLDGDADGVDIGTWATNFTGELGGTGSQVWTQGDWDYDGDVDGVDAGLWAQAFTGELGGSGLGDLVVNDPNIAPGAAAILREMGITVVPEPATSLVLLAGCIAFPLSRRRGRSS
ncbi:MAG TPA: autotransporter-associated beta strand repeat-containing protein [Tepidisphaeraceae bacterium]|jgi:fibronectin-binding autotransporter adhesin